VSRLGIKWSLTLTQAFLFIGAQGAGEKPRGSADSDASRLRASPFYRDSAQQKSRSTANSKPARDLHEIGVVLAKAVLDKNIETLLAYDREDLRGPNAESLKNSKSDLYCYLFDSECITWGDGTWRSVYEKLLQAHPLEIKVQLTSSRYDRQLYGSLFFYDASAISAKDLSSRDFLCKEGPAKIASWKFRLEHGKWKAVTPLFDSETRAGCPDDAPEKE
jgi:hypothetical protein